MIIWSFFFFKENVHVCISLVANFARWQMRLSDGTIRRGCLFCCFEPRRKYSNAQYFFFFFFSFVFLHFVYIVLCYIIIYAREISGWHEHIKDSGGGGIWIIRAPVPLYRKLQRKIIGRSIENIFGQLIGLLLFYWFRTITRRIF